MNESVNSNQNSNQNPNNDISKKNSGKSVPNDKTGYGNTAGVSTPSEADDLAMTGEQQFGSDRQNADERSNHDRTGKYDEADPQWVNPDVQMNNEKNSNREASNTLVDSQTKAP